MWLAVLSFYLDCAGAAPGEPSIHSDGTTSGGGRPAAPASRPGHDRLPPTASTTMPLTLSTLHPTQ